MNLQFIVGEEGLFGDVPAFGLNQMRKSGTGCVGAFTA